MRVQNSGINCLEKRYLSREGVSQKKEGRSGSPKKIMFRPPFTAVSSGKTGETRGENECRKNCLHRAGKEEVVKIYEFY